MLAKVKGNINERFLSTAQIAIRGALGYCIMEVSKELYYYAFKPRRERFRGIMLRRLSKVPKPYIITPITLTDIDTIRFGVRILGNVIYYEEQLVNALARLEGRSLYNVQVKSVEEITCTKEISRLTLILYDKSRGVFRSSDMSLAVTDQDIHNMAMEHLNMIRRNGKDNNSTLKLTISTLTPILLLRDGLNILRENKLKLSDIVAYTARRRSLIEYFYGSRRLYYTAEEVKELMEFVDTNTMIHNIKVEEVDIRIKDKRGFCKGFIEFSFTNKDEEHIIKVIELLILAGFIGIGKMTTFGFGQLALSL
ncbi:MAG: CRISPR system precrRNA processing endoribonuclease RAMP protein Cas6 [Candidatus Nitrosocaldus sp.]